MQNYLFYFLHKMRSLNKTWRSEYVKIKQRKTLYKQTYAYYHREYLGEKKLIKKHEF